MQYIDLLRRFALALGLAGALSACGGGGGGGGDGPTIVAPPTTAATLAQGGSEVMSGVQAINSGAADLLSKYIALEGGSLFSPLGASASPLNLGNTLLRSSREQALARETVSCANLGFSECSGSVTFDSNFDGSSSVLPAGTYLATTFNGLSGSMAGSTLSINGLFRIDFPQSVNLDSTFANVSFQITLNNFAGVVDGVAFGPDTTVALYEFDAQGVATVTVDGLRLRGLDGLNVTDDDNYAMSGVALRTAYWASAASFVDVDFSNWSVAAGKPTAASSATISAGSSSMTVTVQSVSSTTVVYSVSTLIGGVTKSYQVIATYAPGSTVPTYTVIELT